MSNSSVRNVNSAKPAAHQRLWRRVFSGEAPTSTREGIPRLGRYRLLDKLGAGGMGTVFAAEDELLHRRVALKCLKRTGEEARRRFWREARAGARLSHPNICQLFEVGEHEGRLFLAMELLSGEPLSARLRRGPMPVEDVLSLGRDILAALGALHAEGIVHRDLKPSNVFLTPHGAKILDFGLARPLPRVVSRSLDTASGITRPGLIVGSPRYMAPEQILGCGIDVRSDLFAAGAVLYEALAGRPAFPGEDAVRILSATLHDPPAPLAGPGTVVAVEAVIRRALSKLPSE
ncbi:MAG TPA: serine/threonine-protein kinase, partial [Vicinamibacteria bacterium]|nr:serine/threonine-protein kinase [Vicinamibacteria bacterium]